MSFCQLLSGFPPLAGHTDSIASLAFSHDGQLLASGGLDGIVNIWDSSTGTLKQKLEGPGEAIEVSDVSRMDASTAFFLIFRYLILFD